MATAESHFWVVRDRLTSASVERITSAEVAMHILLWVLQVLAALLYGASGTMKVFMFDRISGDVQSFGALPRAAWMALGVMELVCAVALVVPAALHWRPQLTVIAATLLAAETLVFIWVHARYAESGSLIFSAVLGLLMAFVAYGRAFVSPIPGASHA